MKKKAKAARRKWRKNGETARENDNGRSGSG